MSNGLPSFGQSYEIESRRPAMNPNSHQSASSYVEPNEPEGLSPDLTGDKSQHVFPGEPHLLPPDSDSLFLAAHPSQETVPSLPSSGALGKALDDIPAVQQNANFCSPIVDQAHQAHYSSNGATESSPFSEGIVNNALGISSLNETEPLDDIRFPEYFSTQNEEAKGNMKPQMVRSASESPERTIQASAEAATRLDEGNKQAEDEVAVNPGNALPSMSRPHYSTITPLNSLSDSQYGGLVGGGLDKPELGNNLVDHQLEDIANYDNDMRSNYSWNGSTENKDIFTPQAELENATTFPIDESEKFEDGLRRSPTDSSQHNSNTKLNQSREETSSTWFDESKGDFFGDILSSSDQRPSSPSLPQQDRKDTNKGLDSLNHLGHDTAFEKLGIVDQQTFQGDVQKSDSASSTHAKSLQSDAVNQAKSTPPDQAISSVSKEAREEELAAIWRAALGDDELLEEEETSFDPSRYFKDDGPGFLEHDEIQTTQPSLSSGTEPTNFSAGYVVQASSIPQNSPGPSIISKDNPRPILPSLAQSSPLIPQSLQASTGFGALQDQRTYSSNAPVATRPRIQESAQSFSDKSKGGYTSPYDLPMDVVRPKKRTYLKQMQNASDIRPSSVPPPPPPRSSSISSAMTSPVAGPYPLGLNNSGANPSPPTLTSQPPVARAASSVSSSKPRTGSFFEELPSTKPRPANRSRPVSGTTPANSVSQAPFQHGPLHGSISQRPPSSFSDTSQAHQLLPPERIALYSPAHDESLNKVPATSSRYSPAPASQNNIPPIQNRYVSSSSGPRPHQPPHSMSFQPRRSSPLAQSNSVSQHHQRNSLGDLPRNPHEQSHPVEHHVSQKDRGVMQPNEIRQAEIESPRILDSPSVAVPPPNNRYAPVNSVPSKSPYAPQQANSVDPPPKGLGHARAFTVPNNEEPSNAPAEMSSLDPPRRSQTQSPGAVRPRPGLPFNVQEFVQRPASTNHQAAPIHSRPAYGVSQQVHHRGGKPSQSLDFIFPTDGSEHDPLERWKGCPILAFGFGGLTVTSFPKHIPRYAAGQTAPMIKCSPGEVKVKVGKTLPLDENITSFPGPLKSKGKKKEVLDWLQKSIVRFENLYMPAPSDSGSTSLKKCFDEKILLWRILQIFVEHDGVVEGNSIAIKAVKSLLTAPVVMNDAKHPSEHDPNERLVGISRDSGPRSLPRASDPEALESIRQLLLEGQREKAVWRAVDQRMWDHAMLLSSTLDPTIWKQVVHEFVRQEVKPSGNHTQSLAALYQIFAGNWEESIDEIVPPSARAGLQMVSMATGAGPPKNALDGLDSWRETLTLVLTNRSQDDTKALAALGRLLSSYGRPDAAHICYILGKTPGLFGGVDDPQAAIALLGADHHKYPFDYDRDLNNILLTEVYEFAITVLGSSTASVSPHLQAYKLYHAVRLAEHGFKSEAQQYCDAITAALKSTTKLSPYYHSLLFGALEDLIEKLRQAPKDGSQSWISKPSMDKVSGSVWAKFNQFIAGDESDTNSAVSGKGLDHDVGGPFARVSGDSPSLSRTASSNDMYNGYQAGGGIPRSAPTNIPNSRYPLTGPYTPRSSLEQSSSFSHDPRVQSDVDQSNRRPLISPAQYQPQQRSQTEILQKSPPKSYKAPRQVSRYSPQIQSYLPTPPSQPDYAPTAPAVEAPLLLNDDESAQPLSSPGKLSEEGGPAPNNENDSNNSHDLPAFNMESTSSIYGASNTDMRHPVSDTGEQPSNGYSPPSYTYEPPSSTYDPPTYSPHSTGDPESPVEKPKKKMFGDDDDDDDYLKRAAALAKEEKARKDREADEAFRKAAEADCKHLLSFSDIQPINLFHSRKRTQTQ
jgi:hypothetical protein